MAEAHSSWMRNGAWIVLTIVMSLVAPAGVLRADGTKRVYKVAAIGDSLTDERVGGGKYLEVLRKKCPESRFVALGKGGEMVNQMRRRFRRDVLLDGDKAFTDVIVFGGVNDLYSDLTAHRTVAKIEDDLSTMYGLAKERGMRVTAITVAPWGGFSRYFNQRRADATRELNGWIMLQVLGGKIDAVVETWPLLSCGDPERLCPEVAAPFKDGLHFGPLGHQKLGEALFAQAFADCE
jgi:lysophospholipase L1-like esterase